MREEARDRKSRRGSEKCCGRTLMKGASASFARRLAISVFPQPVGPIIKMFFGTMSSLRGLAILCLRQRLRRATATARFASAWEHGREDVSRRHFCTRLSLPKCPHIRKETRTSLVTDTSSARRKSCLPDDIAVEKFADLRRGERIRAQVHRLRSIDTEDKTDGRGRFCLHLADRGAL